MGPEYTWAPPSNTSPHLPLWRTSHLAPRCSHLGAFKFEQQNPRPSEWRPPRETPRGDPESSLGRRLDGLGSNKRSGIHGVEGMQKGYHFFKFCHHGSLQLLEIFHGGQVLGGFTTTTLN